MNVLSGMGKTKDSFPIKYFFVESDNMGGNVRGASSFNQYFSEVGCKLAEEFQLRNGPQMGG